ncbi:hypothetical protein SLS58_007018 [Diplodia intermedia]|uniref:Uncharacterized protein n=1 Tax=Diplodia intermedia TaxID=856260 RepID=A0ABR3TLW0_9PEZI
MACPIHSPSESTTLDAPEYPPDACMRCCQQEPEECHGHPQCLDLDADAHGAVARRDPFQQGPGAVHWSATGNEHEATKPGAEGSTGSQALDTPSSSSDEDFATSCLPRRDAISQGSDMIAISDDGYATATGASSGYADTTSDAVHERFLACDGPWSTYNRRLELPGYDNDDDHGAVAPYVG